MPNERIDQATQTASLVQSAILTQQRHRRRNLDQGKEVNSAPLSELEIREFHKIEEMLNDKFLLNVTLGNLATYRLALLIALRDRELISDKLYDCLFLTKKNQLITEGELTDKECDYFEEFTREKAETFEKSFQNNSVYQAFLNEAIKRQIDIKFEVYGQLCMSSSSNQAVTSLDKKTSDEYSFLREGINSVNSLGLLREIEEQKHEARADCIAKIYLAVNRIHLEDKKGKNISEKSLEALFKKIKDLVVIYKNIENPNNFESVSVMPVPSTYNQVVISPNKDRNSVCISFEDKKAEDIIRLIQLKGLNKVQNDRSGKSIVPISFRKIMQESLVTKKDLSSEQKKAAIVECIDCIYSVVKQAHKNIILDNSQGRHFISEKHIKWLFGKIINAIDIYEKNKEKVCKLEGEKLIRAYFYKMNNDILSHLTSVLNNNGFYSHGKYQDTLSHCHQKVKSAERKKEKIISKFISQLKSGDLVQKDKLRYALCNLNFYIKEKLVLREIISRFIDNFEQGAQDQKEVFKADLIKARFFSEEEGSLEKIIAKCVNKENKYMSPAQRKENLEHSLVKSKSFCKGSYFFNKINCLFLSDDEIKNLFSILPEIIKYEREADARGEELVATLLKKIQSSTDKHKNKLAAEAALKAFEEDRKMLLLLKNIFTEYNPEQLSICIKNLSLPVQPKEQDSVQPSPSEGLETAINDSKPSALEAQGVAVGAQLSISKKNSHLLCSWPSLFIKPKGDEGSPRSGMSDSTVRGLLRENSFLYSNSLGIARQKKLEIKPDDENPGEGNSMELASLSKAMTRS